MFISWTVMKSKSVVCNKSTCVRCAQCEEGAPVSLKTTGKVDDRVKYNNPLLVILNGMHAVGPMTRSKGRRLSQIQELVNISCQNEPNSSQTASSLNQHCVSSMQSQPAKCPDINESSSHRNLYEGNHNNQTSSMESQVTVSRKLSTQISCSSSSCSTSNDTEVPLVRLYIGSPFMRGFSNPSSSTDQCNVNLDQSTQTLKVSTSHLLKSSPSPSADDSSQKCAQRLPELLEPIGVMRCPVSSKPMRTVRCQRPNSSRCNPSSAVTPPSHQIEPVAPSALQPIAILHELGSNGSSGALQVQGSSNLSSDATLKKDKPRKVSSSKISSPLRGLENMGSEALKCRIGLSSYPLRALKTIPLYSENVSVPVLQLGHKRHARNSQLEAIPDTNVWITENNASPMNSLPNEILCLIFSYLPQLELIKTCSTVCHRWYIVTRSQPLWQTLNFSRHTPIEIVAGMIRQAPFLKSITLKNRHDIDIILPILHQQCKRLENVNLVRCKPSDSPQRSLPAKLLYPFLRKNLLHSLNLKGTNYKSRKFYKLLSEMPKLKMLNISCCQSITPQILSEISKQISLRVFKNKWHSDSRYHGPQSMTIQLPGKIDEWNTAYSLLFQNSGKNLTTLEFFAAGLNDAALACLADCKNLKKLSVFNANCFGKESMIAVGSLLNLHELLIHNAKLTTEDVENAFQVGNFCNLKCFHLNDSILKSSTDVSGDDCLEGVAQKCRFLQHLSFTKCSSLTDVGVKSILTKCPDLRSLDLNDCHNVAGQSFLLIPSNTPQLKFITIEKDSSEQKMSIVQGLAESHQLVFRTISTWKHRTTSFYL